MSCQRFVHTQEPDMDWVCVCGHDTDWHNYGPSKPGGPCEACAEPSSAVDLVGHVRDAIEAARERRQRALHTEPEETE